MEDFHNGIEREKVFWEYISKLLNSKNVYLLSYFLPRYIDEIEEIENLMLKEKDSFDFSNRDLIGYENITVCLRKDHIMIIDDNLEGNIKYLRNDSGLELDKTTGNPLVDTNFVELNGNHFIRISSNQFLEVLSKWKIFRKSSMHNLNEEEIPCVNTNSNVDDFKINENGISELKFISKEDEVIDIEVGLGKPIYKTVSIDDKGFNVSNAPKSRIVEIKWKFNGKEYFIRNTEDKSLFGYPTPDSAKMIVIYLEESHQFSNPNNAVIYNADGSYYKTIVAPKLISKTADAEDSIWDQWFDMATWKIDSNGKVVNSMNIGFNWYLFEERAYYYETGEFGEVFRDGRN